MDILMTDDFNPPFRITINDITSDNNQKINDGILTTNIVDEGGLNTKGGYVQVSVEDLHVKEQTKKENSTEAGITGVEIAARIIKECKPYCQGVHIMALGWESKIPDLLKLAEI